MHESRSLTPICRSAIRDLSSCPREVREPRLRLRAKAVNSRSSRPLSKPLASEPRLLAPTRQHGRRRGVELRIAPAPSLDLRLEQVIDRRKKQIAQQIRRQVLEVARGNPAFLRSLTIRPMARIDPALTLGQSADSGKALPEGERIPVRAIGATTIASQSA